MPVGPPLLVSFQGSADLLAPEGPHIGVLLDDGTLEVFTGFGELKLPDLVFVRIMPNRRINTWVSGCR